MARATEGAQYVGASRDYYGGPSKGSPMHDARYGNYVAPHRVDYTRNAPPQSSGTPNFRPPYGAPGQPSYGEWMQQIDPFHTGTYPPKKHPNPRMRHINPRGMGGGLGALQQKSQLRRPKYFTNLDMLGRPDLSFRYSHIDPSKKGIGTGGSGEMSNRPDYFRDDESIRGTWRMMEDARRANEMDEYGYLEGAPRQRTTFTEGYMDPRSFDEMYGGVYDDAIFRTVDPNTNRIEQFPMGRGLGSLQDQAAVDPSDWRNILRILEAGGDPQTETAGIMGAMPRERQMAELGLPADTSWQDRKMPQGMDLQQLIDLGASEEQIAQVLGLA